MRAVVFLLCLNLACWMAYQANAAPSGGLQPIGNLTSKVENITSQVEQVGQKSPENLVTLVTGYVWFGLIFLLDLVRWLVFGFPITLSNLGVPDTVTWPLGALWMMLFGLFIVEFLSGRTTT